MIRSTTCDVISNSLSRKATESEIDTGAIFLLQELAFITRSALILGEEKIAYVYHKTMKILKEIIEGQHNFKSSSVGFITVM
jgi:tRNA-dependent cyclodipeptide synthase